MWVPECIFARIKITVMSKKLIAYLVAAFVLLVPFRYAYVADVSPLVQTFGMVFSILGFFVTVLLFDRGREASN